MDNLTQKKKSGRGRGGRRGRGKGGKKEKNDTLLVIFQNKGFQDLEKKTL